MLEYLNSLDTKQLAFVKSGLVVGYAEVKQKIDRQAQVVSAFNEVKGKVSGWLKASDRKAEAGVLLRALSEASRNADQGSMEDVERLTALLNEMMSLTANEKDALLKRIGSDTAIDITTEELTALVGLVAELTGKNAKRSGEIEGAILKIQGARVDRKLAREKAEAELLTQQRIANEADAAIAELQAKIDQMNASAEKMGAEETVPASKEEIPLVGVSGDAEARLRLARADLVTILDSETDTEQEIQAAYNKYLEIRKSIREGDELVFKNEVERAKLNARNRAEAELSAARGELVTVLDSETATEQEIQDTYDKYLDARKLVREGDELVFKNAVADAKAAARNRAEALKAVAAIPAVETPAAEVPTIETPEMEAEVLEAEVQAPVEETIPEKLSHLGLPVLRKLAQSAMMLSTSYVRVPGVDSMVTFEQIKDAIKMVEERGAEVLKGLRISEVSNNDAEFITLKLEEAVKQSLRAHGPQELRPYEVEGGVQRRAAMPLATATTESETEIGFEDQAGTYVDVEDGVITVKADAAIRASGEKDFGKTLKEDLDLIFKKLGIPENSRNREVLVDLITMEIRYMRWTKNTGDVQVRLVNNAATPAYYENGVITIDANLLTNGKFTAQDIFALMDFYSRHEYTHKQLDKERLSDYEKEARAIRADMVRFGKMNRDRRQALLSALYKLSPQIKDAPYYEMLIRVNKLLNQKVDKVRAEMKEATPVVPMDISTEILDEMGAYEAIAEALTGVERRSEMEMEAAEGVEGEMGLAPIVGTEEEKVAGQQKLEEIIKARNEIEKEMNKGAKADPSLILSLVEDLLVKAGVAFFVKNKDGSTKDLSDQLSTSEMNMLDQVLLILRGDRDHVGFPSLLDNFLEGLRQRGETVSKASLAYFFRRLGGNHMKFNGELSIDNPKLTALMQAYLDAAKKLAVLKREAMRADSQMTEDDFNRTVANVINIKGRISGLVDMVTQAVSSRGKTPVENRIEAILNEAKSETEKDKDQKPDVFDSQELCFQMSQGTSMVNLIAAAPKLDQGEVNVGAARIAEAMGTHPGREGVSGENIGAEIGDWFSKNWEFIKAWFGTVGAVLLHPASIPQFIKAKSQRWAMLRQMASGKMDENEFRKMANEKSHEVYQGMDAVFDQFGAVLKDKDGKVIMRLSDTEGDPKKLANFIRDLEKTEEGRQALGKVRAFAQMRKNEIRRTVANRANRELTAAEKAEALVHLHLAFILSIGKSKGFNFFPVQALAGDIMGDFDVVNFGTGEGKTKTSTIPLYMNFLRSSPGVPAIQLVTTDTFAQDNLNEVKPLFEFLGIKTGRLDATMTDEEKKDLMQTDGIVYSSVSTFFFEYEIDESKHNVFKFDDQGRVIGFLINIDEIDSILVDQAQQEYIISSPEKEADEEVLAARRAADEVADYIIRHGMGLERLQQLQAAARTQTRNIQGLREFEAYVADLDKGTVSLTQGMDAKLKDVLNLIGSEIPMTMSEKEFTKYVEAALYGHIVLREGVDYTIDDASGKILLSDKNTGEQTTRVLSEGKHSALEAKHANPNRKTGLAYHHPRVQISSGRSKTSNKRSTISLITTLTERDAAGKYRFTGFSGTAWGIRAELQAFYRKNVVQVASNVPKMRAIYADKVWSDWNVAAAELAKDMVVNFRERGGAPILLDVESKEVTDFLEKWFKDRYDTLLKKYNIDEIERKWVAGESLNDEEWFLLAVSYNQIATFDGTGDSLEETYIINRFSGRQNALTVSTILGSRGKDFSLEDIQQFMDNFKVIFKDSTSGMQFTEAVQFMWDLMHKGTKFVSRGELVERFGENFVRAFEQAWGPYLTAEEVVQEKDGRKVTVRGWSIEGFHDAAFRERIGETADKLGAYQTEVAGRINAFKQMFEFAWINVAGQQKNPTMMKLSNVFTARAHGLQVYAQRALNARIDEQIKGRGGRQFDLAGHFPFSVANKELSGLKGSDKKKVGSGTSSLEQGFKAFTGSDNSFVNDVWANGYQKLGWVTGSVLTALMLVSFGFGSIFLSVIAPVLFAGALAFLAYNFSWSSKKLVQSNFSLFDQSEVTGKESDRNTFFKNSVGYLKAFLFTNRDMVAFGTVTAAIGTLATLAAFFLSAPVSVPVITALAIGNAWLFFHRKFLTDSLKLRLFDRLGDRMTEQLKAFTAYESSEKTGVYNGSGELVDPAMKTKFLNLVALGQMGTEIDGTRQRKRFQAFDREYSKRNMRIQQAIHDGTKKYGEWTREEDIIRRLGPKDKLDPLMAVTVGMAAKGLYAITRGRLGKRFVERNAQKQEAERLRQIAIEEIAGVRDNPKMGTQEKYARLRTAQRQVDSFRARENASERFAPLRFARAVIRSVREDFDKEFKQYQKDVLALIKAEEAVASGKYYDQHGKERYDAEQARLAKERLRLSIQNPAFLLRDRLNSAIPGIWGWDLAVPAIPKTADEAKAMFAGIGKGVDKVLAAMGSEEFLTRKQSDGTTLVDRISKIIREVYDNTFHEWQAKTEEIGRQRMIGGVVTNIPAMLISNLINLLAAMLNGVAGFATKIPFVKKLDRLIQALTADLIGIPSLDQLAKLGRVSSDQVSTFLMINLFAPMITLVMNAGILMPKFIGGMLKLGVKTIGFGLTMVSAPLPKSWYDGISSAVAGRLDRWLSKLTDIQWANRYKVASWITTNQSLFLLFGNAHTALVAMDNYFQKNWINELAKAQAKDSLKKNGAKRYQAFLKQNGVENIDQIVAKAVRTVMGPEAAKRAGQSSHEAEDMTPSWFEQWVFGVASIGGGVTRFTGSPFFNRVLTSIHHWLYETQRLRDVYRHHDGKAFELDPHKTFDGEMLSADAKHAYVRETESAKAEDETAYSSALRVEDVYAPSSQEAQTAGKGLAEVKREGKNPDTEVGRILERKVTVTEIDRVSLPDGTVRVNERVRINCDEAGNCAGGEAVIQVSEETAKHIKEDPNFLNQLIRGKVGVQRVDGDYLVAGYDRNGHLQIHNLGRDVPNRTLLELEKLRFSGSDVFVTEQGVIEVGRQDRIQYNAANVAMGAVIYEGTRLANHVMVGANAILNRVVILGAATIAADAFMTNVMVQQGGRLEVGKGAKLDAVDVATSRLVVGSEANLYDLSYEGTPADYSFSEAQSAHGVYNETGGMIQAKDGVREIYYIFPSGIFSKIRSFFSRMDRMIPYAGRGREIRGMIATTKMELMKKPDANTIDFTSFESSASEVMSAVFDGTQPRALRNISRLLWGQSVADEERNAIALAYHTLRITLEPDQAAASLKGMVAPVLAIGYKVYQENQGTRTPDNQTVIAEVRQLVDAAIAPETAKASRKVLRRNSIFSRFIDVITKSKFGWTNPFKLTREIGQDYFKHTNFEGLEDQIAKLETQVRDIDQVSGVRTTALHERRNALTAQMDELRELQAAHRDGIFPTAEILQGDVAAALSQTKLIRKLIRWTYTTDVKYVVGQVLIWAAIGVGAYFAIGLLAGLAATNIGMLAGLLKMVILNSAIHGFVRSMLKPSQLEKPETKGKGLLAMLWTPGLSFLQNIDQILKYTSLASLFMTSQGLNRERMKNWDLGYWIFGSFFKMFDLHDEVDPESEYQYAMGVLGRSASYYRKGLTLAYARLRAIESDPAVSDREKARARAAFLGLARYTAENAYYISSRLFKVGSVREEFEARLAEFDPVLARTYLTMKERERFERIEDYLDRGVNLNEMAHDKERVLELIATDPDFSRNDGQARDISEIDREVMDKIRSNDPAVVLEGLTRLAQEMNYGIANPRNHLTPEGLLIAVDDDYEFKRGEIEIRYAGQPAGTRYKLGVVVRTGTFAELVELPRIKENLRRQGITPDDPVFEEAYTEAKRKHIARQGTPPDLKAMMFVIDTDFESILIQRGFAKGRLETHTGTTTFDAGSVFKEGLFKNLDFPVLREEYVDQSSYHELRHFIHPLPFGREQSTIGRNESNVIEEIMNFFAQIVEGVYDYDFGHEFGLEHVFEQKFNQYLYPNKGDHLVDQLLPADRLRFKQRAYATFKTVLGLKLEFERLLRERRMDPALATALVQRLLWNSREFDDILAVQKLLQNPSRLSAMVDELFAGERPIMTVDDQGTLHGKSADQIHQHLAETVAADAVAAYKAGDKDRGKAIIKSYEDSMDRAKQVMEEKIGSMTYQVQLMQLEAQLEKVGTKAEKKKLIEAMDRIKNSMSERQQAQQEIERDYDIWKKQLAREIDLRSKDDPKANEELLEPFKATLTFNAQLQTFLTELRTKMDAERGMMELDKSAALDFISAKLPELVQLAVQVHGERAQKIIAEIYREIKPFWVNRVRQMISKQMELDEGLADWKKLAAEMIERETQRFFEAFMLPVEKSKNLLETNPSQMFLYIFAFDLTNTLFRKLLGEGETLSREVKWKRLELLDQFRTRIQDMVKNNTTPSGRLEEFAARYLQALFWMQQKDKDIQAFIEEEKKLKLDGMYSFEDLINTPDMINRKTGKYIADLKPDPIQWKAVHLQAHKLGFEQILQVMPDGRKQISSGMRNTGSETYGEDDFAYLLHNHPTYGDGLVQVIPSLLDGNHDGVLQINKGGAGFIGTTLGVTKYFTDDSIMESRFDLEHDKPVIFNGVNMTYYEMQEKARAKALAQEAFEYEFVKWDEVRNQYVKVRVEFKPWTAVVGDDFDRAAFMPFAEPTITAEEKAEILKQVAVAVEKGSQVARSEARKTDELTQPKSNAFDRGAAKVLEQIKEQSPMISAEVGNFIFSQFGKALAKFNGRIEGDEVFRSVFGGVAVLDELVRGVSAIRLDPSLTTEFGYAKLSEKAIYLNPQMVADAMTGDDQVAINRLQATLLHEMTHLMPRIQETLRGAYRKNTAAGLLLDEFVANLAGSTTVEMPAIESIIQHVERRLMAQGIPAASMREFIRPVDTQFGLVVVGKPLGETVKPGMFVTPYVENITELNQLAQTIEKLSRKVNSDHIYIVYDGVKELPKQITQIQFHTAAITDINRRTVSRYLPPIVNSLAVLGPEMVQLMRQMGFEIQQGNRIEFNESLVNKFVSLWQREQTEMRQLQVAA